MTVKEYLYSANISEDELARLLGYKTASPVMKRLDEELPERWVRRLEELSEPTPAASNGSDDSTSERAPNPITDEQLNEWITAGRDQDQDPNINNTDQVRFTHPKVSGAIANRYTSRKSDWNSCDLDWKLCPR